MRNCALLRSPLFCTIPVDSIVEAPTVDSLAETVGYFSVTGDVFEDPEPPEHLVSNFLDEFLKREDVQRRLRDEVKEELNGGIKRITDLIQKEKVKFERISNQNKILKAEISSLKKFKAAHQDGQALRTSLQFKYESTAYNKMQSKYLKIIGKRMAEKEKRAIFKIDKLHQASLSQNEQLPTLEINVDHDLVPTEEHAAIPGTEFKCLCKRKFFYRENLRDHIRSYRRKLEGIYFHCELCELKFAYKKNLTRHIKSKH